MNDVNIWESSEDYSKIDPFLYVVVERRNGIIKDTLTKLRNES